MTPPGAAATAEWKPAWETTNFTSSQPISLAVATTEMIGRTLAAMESLDFNDPVTGVDIKMSATNHRAGNDMILSKVIDGVWEPVVTLED